jgi:hypothetical protein
MDKVLCCPRGHSFVGEFVRKLHSIPHEDQMIGWCPSCGCNWGKSFFLKQKPWIGVTGKRKRDGVPMRRAEKKL